MSSLYERMLARYESGELPWDDERPPPEVMDLVANRPAGRALDLGCGTGRASIYLAQLGWEVDGVDFIPKALELATDRAQKAGVSPRFHLTSVTDLDFLSGPYDFALDVGCCHALATTELQVYHSQLKRLLRPGGRYLLFARLRDENAPPEEDQRGLNEATLKAIFADGFNLDRLVHGTTQMSEDSSWASAWFWYTRQGK